MAETTSVFDKLLGATLELGQAYSNHTLQKYEIDKAIVSQEMARKAALFDAQDVNTQQANPVTASNQAANSGQWINGVGNEAVMVFAGIGLMLFIAGRG